MENNNLKGLPKDNNMKLVNCNIDLKYNYYINRKGEIFSEISNRMLKPNKTEAGYLQAQLIDYSGKSRNLSIHRLVLMTFRPTTNMNELQVNHIDGNKLNNNLENLEWVTPIENMQHAKEMKLISPSRGEEHVFSKLKERDIHDIIDLLLEGNLTQKEIGKMFGVNQSVISRIKKKKRWQHVSSDAVFSISKHESKLSEKNVLDIISLLKDGDLNQTQIAKKFNVAPNTISLIKRKGSWKHLTENVDF